MSLKKKDMICILPARGGSQRIKNKNVIKLFGRPIISYPIKTAIKSKLFSEIYVSTDSKKIALEAKKNGAKVLSLRSEKLSQDKIGLREVLLSFIKQHKLFDYDYVCCLYPTAANITSSTLIKAYKKIKNLNFDLIVGIKEVEANPLRNFTIKSNRLSYQNEIYMKKNSQNLKKFYSDAGSFFIFKSKKLKINGLPKKTTFYLHKKYETVDVNTYEDLNYLKKIFKR